MKRAIRIPHYRSEFERIATPSEIAQRGEPRVCRNCGASIALWFDRRVCVALNLDGTRHTLASCGKVMTHSPAAMLHPDAWVSDDG